MVDIISLIIAITALCGTLLHSIRHSECLGCVKIDTRTPKPSPPESPIMNTIESTALLHASNPIPIPEKPKQKKNYL